MTRLSTGVELSWLVITGCSVTCDSDSQTGNAASLLDSRLLHKASHDQSIINAVENMPKCCCQFAVSKSPYHISFVLFKHLHDLLALNFHCQSETRKIYLAAYSSQLKNSLKLFKHPRSNLTHWVRRGGARHTQKSRECTYSKICQRSRGSESNGPSSYARSLSSWRKCWH